MSIIIKFKDSIHRQNFVEKQIKTGEFYRDGNGVVLSNEYPENEKNNLGSEIYSEKNFKNKKRDHYFEIISLSKAYYSSPTTVLEVGAGTGCFARMYINKFNPKKYVFYEYSKPMVKRIHKEFKKQGDTEIDVKRKSFKNISKQELSKYDCIMALQVFEHINWDREFLSSISPGTWIFFSVPRIVNEHHVRAFLTPDSIIYRYKDILDIKEIREIKRVIHFKSKHNYPLKWAIAAKRSE